ncbi:3-oxoadipate enol-lactonase [Ruixingdingia sedimenti]|uniref:3-oxoadipate enol-lactonase n=1 Tax=Ruixingdingia sedimenti TaxID=3073604 RepID=A0ABU1F5B3_9RHOB|nr:3-oxoadipate enol-lactonase [Xinfangfangia sp. LG-4]MDR5651617.1 3-oxoadipate enol-lactonase [Xinfangfangia sp. LG-4]
MERLELNGIPVRVARSGPAGAPAVLLLNSLASDLTMWDGVAPVLARGHDVIRFDARGHGGTGATGGDYTLDLLMADALAVMDALAVDRAHVVGLSLGGMVAQLMAARAPARVGRLVLCATFADSPRDLWAGRVAEARAQGLSGLVEGTLDRWFTPAFRAAEPALVDRVRAMILGTSAAGYAGAAAAIRDMDLTGVPEAIGCPTLLIAGAGDPSAPPAAMRALQARIPGADYAEIAHSAHLFTLERPDAAADLIAGFLTRPGGAERT